MAIALLAKLRSLHMAAIQYPYIVLTLPRIIAHTYVSRTIPLEPALTYLSRCEHFILTMHLLHCAIVQGVVWICSLVHRPSPPLLFDCFWALYCNVCPMTGKSERSQHSANTTHCSVHLGLISAKLDSQALPTFCLLDVTYHHHTWWDLPGCPPLYLCTKSNQILEVGKAWEWD